MRDIKGDLLSPAVVVGAVAFIAALVVVMFFVLNGYKGIVGEDQREVCRLSVLTRATTPHIAQARVPLACTTEKICVTMSGSKDDCPQFLGEENVRVVELDGNNEIENARLIEKISAEAMYQCWSMMGQGKLDLYGKAEELFLGSQGQATCMICSRIAYDPAISNNTLARVNLAHYLETTIVPNTQETYLQRFTDRGTQTFASIALDRDNSSLKLPVDETKTLQGTSNGRQIAFVFSQVKTVPVLTVLSNLGSAAVGSTFAISQIPLVNRVAGALVLNPVGAAVTVVGGAAVGAGAGWSAYQGQRAAAGYCGEFTTSDTNLKDGCSVVQAVNYNPEDINVLCPTTQGNP